MRTITLIGMLSLCSSAPSHGQTRHPAKEPTLVVRRPTVVAFFPITPREVEKDPDTNEALSDFQFYAAKVRKPLSQLGVDFYETYARTFRVTNGGKTTEFRAGSGKVGYYFVAPSKFRRIEYGVETDEDLFQAVEKYFGLAARRGSIGNNAH